MCWSRSALLVLAVAMAWKWWCPSGNRGVACVILEVSRGLNFSASSWVEVVIFSAVYGQATSSFTAVSVAAVGAGVGEGLSGHGNELPFVAV